MKYLFKTCVHEDPEGMMEVVSQWEKQIGIQISDELRDKLERINYEICLVYEVDTDNNSVKLIEVDGHRIL